MSITSVSFTFENGVKREEYGPTRKASATIVYGVDDHENGEAVLAHIAHVALHRVQDTIGAPQPSGSIIQTPTETIITGGLLVEDAPEVEEPGRADADIAPTQRRARRTKAQIEADNAAAEADKQTVGEPPDTSSGSPASPPESERIIDNAELTGACAAAAQRLGGIVAVKELIKEYTGRDPPQVADILSAKRQEFLDKLAAMK